MQHTVPLLHISNNQYLQLFLVRDFLCCGGYKQTLVEVSTELETPIRAFLLNEA